MIPISSDIQSLDSPDYNTPVQVIIISPLHCVCRQVDVMFVISLFLGPVTIWLVPKLYILDLIYKGKTTNYEVHILSIIFCTLMEKVCKNGLL